MGVPESVTCAYRHEQRPLVLRLLSVLVSVSVSVWVSVLGFGSGSGSGDSARSPVCANGAAN